jgi:hypothetical protein
MDVSETAVPNSPVEIQKRVAAGKITWAGPFIMLVTRSVLAVICQALVAAIFYSNNANPWIDAGQWWTVYGTVIDVGCIILLFLLARREGIRLFDLGSYSTKRLLRNILIGLGLAVVIVPILSAGPQVFVNIAFDMAPPMGVLPMAGFLYSLIIWLPIWVFTEDNTYLGFCLPRVEALTGRKWLAVVLVGFFFTLQHVFLPLRLEWRAIMAQFLTFIPYCFVLSLLYLRKRRLLPLHIIHYLADITGVLTAFFMASAASG